MSLTNKIVANIKKTSADINGFLDTSNVVCIDTSNNRIGINTKRPRYSIDIAGTAPSNLIYVNKLIIERDAIIRDISCQNNIDATSATIGSIKYTSLSGDTITCNKLTTISAEIIDLSINKIVLNLLRAKTLDASTINVTNGGVLSGDISINNLFVTGTFYGGSKPNYTELELVSSSITTINSANSYITNIDCSTIKVDICANFNRVVNCNVINISFGAYQTLSGNILRANNFSALSIDSTQILTQDCSINGTLYVNSIKDSTTGKSIIQSGGALIVETSGSSFFGLRITDTLTIDNNCDISNLRISKKLDFSNAASLIIPTYSSAYTLKQPKSLAIDISDMAMNIIKLYNSNSSWSNIYTKNHYASLDIKREISGNDISSVLVNTQINYFIENSNNLIINLSDANYKYIPLSFKYIGTKIANSGLDIFKIVDISSNRKSGILRVPDICGVYEINATITMKYLNRIPGDVEPNTYTFGLYNSILRRDISYIYLENINNILTFDNSFNYSSAMLNYIGPLFNNSDGFVFLISSAKDLDYLVIDRFNGSIKLLNY